jgi:uncharacterized damage-inducible protein DinB
MVDLETLRELYDYNYWSRDRQLAACSKLDEEQFARPMGNSFSSLRETIAHLVGVEWIWLERLNGRSPQGFPSWMEDLQTVGQIHERWNLAERDMRTYLGTLDQAGLSRPLSDTNLKGERLTYPLGQILFHLANHQTYHRGQVTTLLRQLGAAAVAVDFLVYFDSPK